jgi:hypothetical protein
MSMLTSLEETVHDVMVPLRNEMTPSHFEFFFTWRYAVEMIGAHLFGDGTLHGVNQAVDYRDLRPNLPAIRRFRYVVGRAAAPGSRSRLLF